jgi:copper transport protein
VTKIARHLVPVIVLLAVLAWPRPASAHAAFVSSEPQPGERLEFAPGVVSLTFSEPLNFKLSHAEVTDPTGRMFETSSTSDRKMTVRLDASAPGSYEVRWTTVSPLDGHTLRGTLLFGVRVTPTEAEAATSTAPTANDIMLAAARTLEYAGLLTAGGMLLLIGLARRRERLDWVRPSVRAPLLIAAASGLAVVAGEAAAAGSSLSSEVLSNYLFSSGLAGWARLTRVVAEVVALWAVLVHPSLAVAPLALAFGALASAGHAAALRPAWWGITVDAIHLVSASLWAGGILALARIRSPDGWRGPQGAKLLERFTPVALNAFALTVSTGILRATQELSAPLDLIRSSYGRVLAAKIIGVLVMVPLSVRAWRRLAGSFSREATLAVVVIGAAAILAAYPLPPGRAEEAEEAAVAAVGSSRAVPLAGDLTLGEGAGQTLVGLTLRPGEPGRNEALIFVLPIGGPDAARDVPVSIGVGSRQIDAVSCGTTCRRAFVRLDGGERLLIDVGGHEGGTAAFDVPRLAAANGADLVRAGTKRMRELDTLRVAETLGPAHPPIRTDYAYRAPDRMRIDAGTRYRLIAIGSRQYQWDSSSKKWSVSEKLSQIDAPAFQWSSFKPVAARITVKEKVDGVETTVVSFFAGDVANPVWFKLWIDRSDLVHRMEMRAIGHFMDQRLLAFDEPVSIEPPGLTGR